MSPEARISGNQVNVAINWLVAEKKVKIEYFSSLMGSKKDLMRANVGGELVEFLGDMNAEEQTIFCSSSNLARELEDLGIVKFPKPTQDRAILNERSAWLGHA